MGHKFLIYHKRSKLSWTTFISWDKNKESSYKVSRTLNGSLKETLIISSRYIKTFWQKFSCRSSKTKKITITWSFSWHLQNIFFLISPTKYWILDWVWTTVTLAITFSTIGKQLLKPGYIYRANQNPISSRKKRYASLISSWNPEMAMLHWRPSRSLFSKHATNVCRLMQRICCWTCWCTS